MERLIPLVKDHPTLPVELTNGNLSAATRAHPGHRRLRRQHPQPHADVLPGLPAPRLVQRAAGAPQEPARSRVHAARAQARARGPGRPRRHRLLHHAHVRAHQAAHAQLLGHGPGRRHRQRASTRSSPTSSSSSWAMARSSTPARSPSANAIKAGQDITFIILDNKTTAMTGHQEHCRHGARPARQRHGPADIEDIVRGHGAQAARRRRQHRPDRPGRPRPTTASSGEDDPRRWREGHHRRQGMRHHPPSPPLVARSAEPIKEKGYLPRRPT